MEGPCADHLWTSANLMQWGLSAGRFRACSGIYEQDSSEYAILELVNSLDNKARFIIV